ncbi:MAG: hypothetical protein ACF8Q5_10035 [Phycisphaerales bacterium JB040]
MPPHTPHALSTPFNARTPAALLAVAALLLASCGESEPEFAPARGGGGSTTSSPTTSDTPDTPSPSGTQPSRTEPSPSTTTSDGRIPDAPERDFVEETGARSTLGRTRDSARDIRDQLQGGQETSPLAITTPDEEWVQVANVRWDMPEGWRIAVPQDDGVVAEMAVPSTAYGTGRILFTRTESSPERVIADWSTYVLDSIGDPADAQTEEMTVAGRDVTLATLRGTYLEGARENPFYAVNLLIVDLTDGTYAVGTYIANESNYDENRAKWLGLANSMEVR